MPQTLFLIDGHSLIYRAIYTKGPKLTSRDGEPTRGTFFFCQMLMRLCREHQPDFLAMAVDPPRKTYFRRKIFPPYKAQRPSSANPEIQAQIKRIREIVYLMDVPLIEQPTFEADDVLATLVEKFHGPDLNVVLVSRDKDLHQLIRPGVTQIDPTTREEIAYEDVEARWGVPAERGVEMQTLMGDPTDNVPGVPGIGQKRAAELLTKYGSIEALLEHADELPPKTKANLTTADLDLARQLVELRRDVDLDDVDLDLLKHEGLDVKHARPVFQLLGFHRWSA